MARRGFLKTGSQAIAAGSIVLATRPAPAAQPQRLPDKTQRAPLPSLMRDYSEEDHRQRLQNISRGTASIRHCLRQHLITQYLPAQCCYNLGEYPARRPWNPGAEDEQELDRLKNIGIQVIQVFDDWNDSLRLFGGDKFSAVNPAGYRRFLEMAHRRGMKVLTYTSTCFLQRSDPEFQQKWSRPGDYLEVGYWDMARCSPASPGWRAFVLKKFIQILDEYAGDGIYIDGGYLMNRHERKRQMPLAADEIAAFKETPTMDGAFADLLALIYAEVKQRGGIVKLHVDGADCPLTELKTYDYLWVGEGVRQADALRETIKNHPPYVVPCLDMGFTNLESADEPYLHSIPYLQFPVTMGGRIFTGERGMIPGVKYRDDFWLKRCRDAWKQYQSDPAKLYTYSAWDEVPGSAETRAHYARWLKQYLPLTETGTWAWLEIRDSTLFTTPLPAGVVASLFANRQLHLVLANYQRVAVPIATADPYLAAEASVPRARQHWSIPPRSLLILRRPV